VLPPGSIGPGPELPASVVEQAGGRSPFESYALVSVLALMTLIAIGSLVRWRRFRARRLAFAVPVVLALVTVAAAVNSYVGYVRSFGDLGRLVQIASGGNAADEGAPPLTATPVTSGRSHDPRNVRVADLSVPDPRLGVRTGRTRVLLPPGYDDPAQAGRRYPVVYLVHGYPSGGPDDWLGGGGAVQTLQALVQSRASEPMIVVAVDATAGSGTDWECLNVPGGPQLESYLTTTVPQAVDTHFRTISDPGDRAIGGMSGGAFCALNLGLRNQNTYSVILSTEPYDDPGEAGPSLLAGHPDLLRANTPRDYIPTMLVRHPIAVMLHAGIIADSDVQLARRTAGQLAARGFPVALRVEPGEWHTWRTARIGLPYLLKFAAEHFSSARHPDPQASPQSTPPRAAPPTSTSDKH
jgi:S-formylglutathione hydrolase FrmB